MRLATLATIHLTLAVSAAYAQNAGPTTTPQFTRVLQAPQHRSVVIEAAKQSTSWIKRSCQSTSFVPLPGIRIWTPPEFDSTGAPIKGEWGESVLASGCGFTKKLNVGTAVIKPQALVTGVLAPGDTEANPTLQLDTSRYVFAAATGKAPSCKDRYLDDTKAVRKEPPTDPILKGPVVVENWIVMACGQTIAVEVKFMPTADGTTIGAHAL
jgi:hypothetical protein